MIGGTLGFLLFAILIPLLVNEAGDLVPSLARCLLRWGARRIGDAEQAARYEEEWLADLERVPGKRPRSPMRAVSWSGVCPVCVRNSVSGPAKHGSAVA